MRSRCGALTRLVYAAIAALAAVAAESARAASLDAGDVPVDVHAFVSQGALKSTGNNYLAYSKRGSLEFTEVGVNFRAQLADRLSMGLQLFAHDLGPQQYYSARADWFDLDYRWRDWLGVRAGRVKIPFGLYNETSDIDAARVSVLLPQSVYPATDRDYLLAQTGVELYGYVDLRAGGGLEYRLYGGTIYLDAQSIAPAKSVDVPYVAGGRLMWETPLSGLRVGGSAQALRLVLTEALDPTMPTALRNLGVTAWLGVGSVEFVRNDLTLAAELSEWRVRLDQNVVALLPVGSKQVTVSARSYVSGTYHVSRWLWPGAYYSVLFPDEATATFMGESKNMQHDFAATLRFDINARWLVKLEGHYMHGTAGVDGTLNGNPMSLDALTRDWAVFLAKTTAYF
jgi:hypothetical protein